jgi:sugar phosphate isomerase/epimerase
VTVELGIFARIFPRDSAADVAAAVAGAGFSTTQLNLSSVGLPTLPAIDDHVDLAGIAGAFGDRGVRIWGLSATYNTVHPDEARRRSETARARALIRRAADAGAAVATLCTGSRDECDMWRRHPGNDTEEAWWDLRDSLDQLLPAAEEAGIVLGLEPESGNVVSDAGRARRLLNELGADARLVGIVLDPANLLTVPTLVDQGRILREAFAELGPHIVGLHAKDVLAGGGYSAAGAGEMDYELVLELYADLPVAVPIVIQDATEEDVPRTRQFLLSVAQRHR